MKSLLICLVILLSFNISVFASEEVIVITSINPYNDAFDKNLSNVDEIRLEQLIPYLNFDSKTIWPSEKISQLAKQTMIKGMNPGLGIKDLHKEGITGKGVNVGIIDQPVLGSHPEFQGRITAYRDFCPVPDLPYSMHGSGVTSILAGKNIGTAPDVGIYYASVPNWLADSAYYARALTWLMNENAKLPPDKKIRVVSVSANPADQIFQNIDDWLRVRHLAEESGLLILDCSDRTKIISCWSELNEMDDITKWQPGFSKKYPPVRPLTKLADVVLAPAAPRTIALEYGEGEYGYGFFSVGGLSWSIPYAAGVLALGWQVDQELSNQDIMELLFNSAYTRGFIKIIDPPEFIRMVREHDHHTLQ